MFRDEYTLLALSMVSGSGHCYWGQEPEYVPSFLGGQNVRWSACITKHHLGNARALTGSLLLVSHYISILLFI